MGFADFLSGLFGGGGGGAPGYTFSMPEQGVMGNEFPQAPAPFQGPPSFAPTQPSVNPLGIVGAVAPALISAIGGRGQGAGDKALKQARNATGQLAQAGGQSLNAYQTGTLQPMQQALIDRQKQVEEAALQQYAAKAGIPVSTFVAQSEGDIAGHMAALENQMYQQNFNNAYQAIGSQQNNLIHIAQMQAQQDAAQRQAWQEFMKALGGLGTQLPNIF